MTPEEITQARERANEAKARADAATKGPWKGFPNLFGQCREVARFPKILANHQTNANAALIAHARADVPTLAADVLALADEVERVRRLLVSILDTIEAVPRDAGKVRLIAAMETIKKLATNER